MKITSEKKAGRDVVLVTFAENATAHRFVEKNGQKTLEMKVAKTKELDRRKWILLMRSIVKLAQLERHRFTSAWEKQNQHRRHSASLGGKCAYGQLCIH